MARPREFDEDKALDLAMNLFWSKGYGATSLQDLLKTMNLSRSSFYQTFSSKHEILERSIERYQEMIADDMFRNLDSAASGLQFIKDTLIAVAESVDQPGGRRGCLVMNCANEFAQNDPVIAGLVVAGTARFRQAFLAAVKRAQQEGGIPVTKDAEVLAHYLVSCKSGLETMAKSGTSQKEIKDVINVMISALS